jgi:PAS domain S-box-containing protein
MTPAIDARTAKILLVDDRPENLVALEAVLLPLGHTLIRANSGAEALKQVLLHDFAVILLDVQMPGMNGFEAAELIKSRERSRHVPIIFLTAISKEEEYVFRGYSAGAVDYLFKPFNPDVLRSKVSVFVELDLKGRQLEQQGEMLRAAERRELELHHRARLLESEARFVEIVASALEAIVSFSPDRRITLFNAAAEGMFACPAGDALGSSVDEFFHPCFPDEMLESSREAAAAQKQNHRAPRDGNATRELVGLRRTGDQFPIELSVSCLSLSDEQVFTLVGRDISERRRAEEELRSQAVSLANTTEELRVVNEELHHRQVELERAMTARSRFYANMSHELRTPINAIMGYTQLLLEKIYGPLNDQQARSIDRTFKAAQHLLELVNDILDLSKIEAGKMELQVEPVSFSALIQDLFVTVAPMAQQHSVSLDLVVEREPGTIVTDPRRVRQILLNLLSNAIKFGDEQPVRVAIRGRDDGWVEVDVTDQGPGIAPEDQLKIFDEFVQLEEAHRTQGTGLGLPISRRLSELLGGSLTVHSATGEGSTFRFALPPSDDPGASASSGARHQVAVAG